MDISEMLAPLVMDVLRGRIKHGANSQADSKELEALRTVLRERLRREMRYNAELLKEQKLDANIRILNLETDTLEFAVTQGVPLQTLLNRSISESVLQKAAGGSVKHLADLLALNSEDKLIERLMHRVKVVKIRAKYGISLGDVSYLRKLVFAAQLALSEE
jgi:hypothetical protein